MHGKQLETPWLWPTSATGAQPADPIPQGLQIFIVKRQFSNAIIKVDRVSQASFRLLHAACDASVAGEAEGDQSILGMYRLPSQQNGFRLPYTLCPSDRIGESDPPGVVFRLNLYQMAGNPLRPYPISWPPCRGSHVRRRLRCGSYPLARSLPKRVPHRRTFPIRDSHLRQGHAFANRLSRDSSLLKKEKERFGGHPDD